MKTLENRSVQEKSIKSLIRSLQLSTILVLILLGCFFAIFIYATNMRSQKITYLESVLDTFETEAITALQESAHEDATVLSKIMDAHETEPYGQIVDDYALFFDETTFAIVDERGTFLYTSDNLPFTSADVMALISQGDMSYRFVGSETSGIHILSYEKAKKSGNYIIVEKKLPEGELVNSIKSRFNVDASIFYKDYRLSTSIEIDGENITGSLLDPKVAEELLSVESRHIGNVNILQVPYISAYQSFGNADESPICILFVGESMGVFYRSISDMILSIGILGFVLMLISSFVTSRLTETTIVKPLEDVTAWLGKYTDVENGDKPPVYFKELEHLFETTTSLLKRLNKARHEVESIAYYDDLTGLPNRFYLFHQHRDPDECSTHPKGILIYIDADNIKTVNDLMGHMVGDRLIRAIGDYLVSLTAYDPGFEVYRVGGDEFVIWHDETLDLAVLEVLLQHVKEISDAKMHIDDYSVTTTLSIGVAFGDEDVDSFDMLLRNAEIAMYQVKHATKDHYIFYDTYMGKEIVERQALENDLKYAIEREELFLVYQPKLNLKTGKCDGFEALIRWQHPERGIVSPLEFIQIAEQNGSIIQIGSWVLEESCRKIKHINSETGARFRVSVNVSPVQVMHPDFVKQVISTMIMQGVEPSLLELEITESVLIETLTSAVEKLRQLLVLGVNIAIDDFGKGYSSLAYLKQLPITTLKIDKMFVDDIEYSDTVMIGDIIDLAHNLGLKIVAEGIETKHQYDYLENVKCDAIQGYYYAKPLLEQDLITFIQEKNS